MVSTNPSEKWWSFSNTWDLLKIPTEWNFYIKFTKAPTSHWSSTWISPNFPRFHWGKNRNSKSRHQRARASARCRHASPPEISPMIQWMDRFWPEKSNGKSQTSNGWWGCRKMRKPGILSVQNSPHHEPMAIRHNHREANKMSPIHMAVVLGILRSWCIAFENGNWAKLSKTLPSGKLTVCYWKWQFIVHLPIKYGDFP